MFYSERKKKKISIVKIVLAVAAISAAVAAVATAVMLWKKKKCIDSQVEDEIEAVINEAFAEEDDAEEEAE